MKLDTTIETKGDVFLTKDQIAGKSTKKKDKLTFNLLACKSEDHLVHIISISKNKDDLLFNLAGFYGGLIEVLKENYLLLS